MLRSHRIAVGLYDRTGAGLIRRRRVEVDIAGERTVLAELAGERQPDLVLVNDDDLSYAKIRLDAHSLGTLVSAIGEFTEPLPAALCWAAAWDMCRDAELAARHYIGMVIDHAHTISEIGVLQTTIRQASAAARRFTDPAWRPEGIGGLMAPGLRRLAEQAEPGSDRQLAYLQAFAGVATRPDDLALLAGLLDGSAHLDGLEVDTELRWRLLQRLASQGAAGPAEIDAELERDPTDAGERRAATCRAAIPEPAAKEAAWQAIISGTLPGATFRATVNGFQDPDHPELLEPYADPVLRRGRRRVGQLEQRHGAVLRQQRLPADPDQRADRAADRRVPRAGRPAGRAAPPAQPKARTACAGRCAASRWTRSRARRRARRLARRAAELSAGCPPPGPPRAPPGSRPGRPGRPRAPRRHTAGRASSGTRSWSRACSAGAGRRPRRPGTRRAAGPGYGPGTRSRPR